MAYQHTNTRGVVYYLHARTAGKNGTTKLYFFAKEVKEGAVDALPEGYEVIESQKTGLPILRKKR
jgi:hypothetical protein